MTYHHWQCSFWGRLFVRRDASA